MQNKTSCLKIFFDLISEKFYKTVHVFSYKRLQQKLIRSGIEICETIYVCEQLIIIFVTHWEVFTQDLTHGHSLEFEWKQVYPRLQDSS